MEASRGNPLAVLQSLASYGIAAEFMQKASFQAIEAQITAGRQPRNR
ncbi:MAG: hypothetical protein ACK5N0_16230 [Synechococcaceae cyanobacterium]